MPRPFLQNTVEDMRKFMQNFPHDIARIKDIRCELTYRSSAAAQLLATDINRHLREHGVSEEFFAQFTVRGDATAQSTSIVSTKDVPQQPGERRRSTSVSFQQTLPSSDPTYSGISIDALSPNSPQARAAEPRIRELRSRLLDLTTRNRLLNFKHSVRGGRYVRIVDEDPTDLFSQLQNDKVVELVGLPDPPDQPDDEASDDFLEALEEAVLTDKTYLKEVAEIEEAGGDDADAKMRAAERKLRDKLRRKLGLLPRSEAQSSARDYALRLGINPDFDLVGSGLRRRRAEKYWQTLLSEDDLARRLRGIEQSAREARQEYGIDTLYFVFGFLEWSPPAVDGKSEEILFAPLVLYPATIEKKIRSRDRAGGYLLIEDGSGESSDRRDRFQLAAADADEPAANLTLRERLREDYNIVLPELDPEDPDLDRFFAQVEQLIRTFPGWRLRRFVTLTHLSFNRLPMWRDLDPSVPGKIPPHRHRLLGGLFGGRDGDESDTDETQNEGLSGSVVPPLLRDCDSSQYAAIKAALAGKNLIIQGPPGTGKSQTITNLIGALLHQGKSVLFVAEKQAALDVVYKRLADVGLEDFLLQLHSAKAGKKQVIESIRARLLRQPRSFDAVEDQRVRDAHRSSEAELNAYAETINSPFGALGLSLHDIFWREFKNRDFAELPRLARFSFKGVESWTKEDYEVRQRAIADWQVIVDERHTDQEIKEWDWVVGSDLHVREQKDILHLVRTAGVAAAKLVDTLRDANLTNPEKASLEDVRSLARKIEEGGDRPADCTPNLWSLARTPDVEQTGRTIVEALDAIAACRADIETIAPGALVHPNAVDRQVLSVRRFLIGLGNVGVAPSSTELTDRQHQIELLQQELPSLLRKAEKLKELPSLGSVLLESSGPAAVADFIELEAATPPEVLRSRINLGDDATVPTLKDACATADRLRSAMAELQQRVAVRLEDIETGELVDAKKRIEDASFTSWLFDSDFRRAQKLVRRLFPNAAKAEIPALIQEVLSLKRAVETLNSHDACGMSAGLFHGIDSAIDRIRVIIDWAERVRAATPIIEAPRQRLRSVLFDPNADMQATASMLASEGWPESLRKLGKICEQKQVAAGDLALALETEKQQLEELLAIVATWRCSDRLSDGLLNRLTTNARSILDAEQLLSRFENIRSSLGDRPREALPVLAAIRQFVTWVASSPLPESWRQQVMEADGGGAWERLRAQVLCVSKQCSEIDETLQELTKLSGADSLVQQSWSAIPLQKIVEQMTSLAEREHALNTRCRECANHAVLRQFGLSHFIGLLAEERPAGVSAVQVFDRIANRTLCERAFEQIPGLRNFRQQSPSVIAEKFRRYDKLLQEKDRNALIHALTARPVPAGNGVGRVAERTEKSLLLHVAGQQRPRTPIRELMRRSAKALMALKPCFMMSPLSVAQLIERGSVTFDVVVFDEASQVRPEDALCAMARARQFVVVGDQMQLPPTSFGERNARAYDPDEEEDEEDKVGGVESILELAASAYGEGRMLLWHYRSRDPSLIAYSNREFYGNKLQIFPSPRPRSRTMGVHYVPVVGTYSARTNVIEARVCANAAIEFMRTHPDRSLGIVALNRPQADLIELELDRLIDQHPHAQDYRATWADGLESLFVKNLESVQGDERDVIFISTVFGLNEDGAFNQRFGPINGHYGYRRLNVLFTRAKDQMVVFSSIPQEQIHVTPDSRWGVRALKGYLEFAKTGQLPATITGRGTDSPFEDSVWAALRDAGYECEPQLGVAGFFIDLAVKDASGNFILGIECDGSSYHSSRWARDRDRLRQEILEGLGWKIHRVWSTDWFSNAKGELEKLLQRLRHLAAETAARRDATSVDYRRLVSEIAGAKAKTASSSAKTQTAPTKEPSSAAKPRNGGWEGFEELVATELARITEPRLRRLLEEAFKLSPLVPEVWIEVTDEGVMRHARLVEAYNRHVWLWLEGNKRSPLIEMPWPAELSTADKVRLRAQAVKEVVARLRPDVN